MFGNKSTDPEEPDPEPSRGPHEVYVYYSDDAKTRVRERFLAVEEITRLGSSLLLREKGGTVHSRTGAYVSGFSAGPEVELTEDSF